MALLASSLLQPFGTLPSTAWIPSFAQGGCHGLFCAVRRWREAPTASRLPRTFLHNTLRTDTQLYAYRTLYSSPSAFRVASKPAARPSGVDHPIAAQNPPCRSVCTIVVFAPTMCLSLAFPCYMPDTRVASHREFAPRRKCLHCPVHRAGSSRHCVLALHVHCLLCVASTASPTWMVGSHLPNSGQIPGYYHTVRNSARIICSGGAPLSFWVPSIPTLDWALD